MMRSLYSGVAGLRAHQTKMDVIGNNIANVNTYAFNSQRVTFRDMLYQTLKTPGASSANGIGGTNPSQVGYGSQIGMINVLYGSQSYSPTDNPMDVFINGDGYFAVHDGNNTYFTKLGDFTFDNDGYLVDGSGFKVQGYGLYGPDADGDGSPDPKTGLDYDKFKDAITSLTDKDAGGFGNVDIDSAGGTVHADLGGKDRGPIIIDREKYTGITINADGTITGTLKAEDPDFGGKPAETIVVLGFVPVATFSNEQALVMQGNSYYSESANSGDPMYEVPGNRGSGRFLTGGLQMSNVDLAREFSDMITTQRGFQANTKIISVVDEMLQELANLKR